MKQTFTVTRLTIASIPQRFWMSVSTVLAIATVVGVLLSFLALSNGFRETLDGTGSERVAIALRAGASAEINSGIVRSSAILLDNAPGVARGPSGRALTSGELYVVVDARKKSSGTEANIPLRGMDPAGLTVRDGVSITAGRMFTPGRNEIVVGQGVISEFDGFDLGARVSFAQSQWTVVGIFSAGGGVFESELWADRRVVQNQFNRGNSVQSVRLRLTDPTALPAIQSFAEADPRLNVDIVSEKEYFASQSSGTATLIRYLAYPLSFAMAIGALAGALNTMYTAVSARTREIATLRALGFGGFPTFVGTLVESMLLSAIGGVVGAYGAFLVFDGLKTSTLGGGFTQVVFTFRFSAELVRQGMILALVIGFLGGFAPALRASRIPVVRAFSAN